MNAGDPTKIDISWTDYPTGMVLTTPEKTLGGKIVWVSIEAVETLKKLTVIYRSQLAIGSKDNPS